MSFMDELKDKAGDLAGKAKDVAGDVGEKAKHLADEAKDKVDDLTHRDQKSEVLTSDNETAADLDSDESKPEDTTAPYA